MTRRVPFTDLASLLAWLDALRPQDRVHTARLLADGKTQGELARLANGEIYERTRTATTTDVARDLGISERVVRRAVTAHIRATGAERKTPGRRPQKR